MSAEWRPCDLLGGKPTRPYAVLVMNQPINRNALQAVIESASMLVCADAGADRLFEWEHSLKDPKKKTTRIPDAIVGDLDSLSPAVEKHYRDLGVEIFKDADQYAPDFTKSLRWIRSAAMKEWDSPDATMDVVVLGGLGGRVDQGFSQIHHLYLAKNHQGLLNGRIYLLSEQSLSFVLDNGVTNLIRIQPGYFEENVGIIPILGPTTITTKGLEWDVTDWPTEFGGQVSTSNHIRSDTIEISFDGKRSPLFTLELAERLATTQPS